MKFFVSGQFRRGDAAQAIDWNSIGAEATRILAPSQFGIHQREPGPPRRGAKLAVDEQLHGGRDFGQAALFASQREHLHAVDACRQLAMHVSFATGR